MSPVVALYVSWALTGLWPVTSRAASAYCDPLLFGFLHLALGLLAIAPWMSLERWRRILGPELRVPFMLLGGLGSGLTTALLQTAMGYTTAANGAIVCQVEVVYSAVLSAWLLGERITGRQIAASLLVLAGTGLVLAKDLGSPHWKGDLIILLTPWMYQVSHVTSKRLPPDVDAVTITAARQLWGAAVLAACAGSSLLLGSPRFEPAWPLAGYLAFHAVIMNVVTCVLWYIAVRHLELSKTTAVMLSYPALTLVYCWLLGLEPIGAHQVAGLALSMAGALWLTLQMRVVQPAPVAAAAAPASSLRHAG
ncbi:MAG: DMT family transporter [Elusimicrobia bacterium]|nr:DMT family transporter [Elusimicrobiota bacterium]